MRGGRGEEERREEGWRRIGRSGEEKRKYLKEKDKRKK